MEVRLSCKIFITHPNAKDESFVEDALHLDDRHKEYYGLRWDPKAPDILFANEVIFYDRKMWDKFIELYDKAKVCVFFPGEGIAPDLNIFDYGITCTGYDGKDDRVYRIPPRIFYSDYLIGKKRNPVKTTEEAKRLLEKKKGFANFIYSNPNGHPNRKVLFELLSIYKRVDSYGAYLNNMGLEKSGGSDFTKLIRNSTDIKSDYKFTIAAENAIMWGYTTEKIFTSLEAGTIPIYWGNPDISFDVNPEAIINCHSFHSFDEMLERVKEVDRNDDLWCEIISKPWLTEQQEKREKDEMNRLYDFLDKLFLSDISTLRRRPEGTWPQVYQNFWLSKESGSDKYRTYFEICSSFCKKIQSGKHIYEALDKDAESVAIYGMGDIGRIVFNDLISSNEFSVPYCIDNRAKMVDLGVDCVRLSDLSEREKPDIVIVTVPGDFDVIRKSILKVFNTKVISVMDLIK